MQTRGSGEEAAGCPSDDATPCGSLLHGQNFGQRKAASPRGRAMTVLPALVRMYAAHHAARGVQAHRRSTIRGMRASSVPSRYPSFRAPVRGFSARENRKCDARLILSRVTHPLCLGPGLDTAEPQIVYICVSRAVDKGCRGTSDETCSTHETAHRRYSAHVRTDFFSAYSSRGIADAGDASSPTPRHQRSGHKCGPVSMAPIPGHAPLQHRR